jgi:hypothetical protein
MPPATLLLDQLSWDLVLDASRNIALASPPYALAQDAASAIKTFLGECYWDTTVGLPWMTILGQRPALGVLKSQLIAAAETVPDVASAQVFFTSVSGRVVAGQVQVISASTGQVSAAPFSVINPQGSG